MMGKTYVPYGTIPMTPKFGPERTQSSAPASVEDSEIVDWEFCLEYTPSRPSGTVEAVLQRVTEEPPFVDPE